MANLRCWRLAVILTRGVARVVLRITRLMRPSVLQGLGYDLEFFSTARSFNGRTAASGAAYRGSNPCRAANSKRSFRRLNRNHRNHFLFHIQLAVHDYRLSRPLFGFFLIIQTVNVILHHQHERASEMVNAMSSAVGGGRSEGLRFQHFLVRPRQRVDIVGAGTVANFTAKSCGVARCGGEDGEDGDDQVLDSPGFHKITRWYAIT